MASVLLVLLSFVMSVGSISAQPAPGCQTHCGGVEIPYPFGIGAGCAIDKSFEISCNKTIGGERPFISNVEVQNICVPRQNLGVKQDLDILLQQQHKNNGARSMVA
jgi:hypothetical protein